MHAFLPKNPPIKNYKTKAKSLKNLENIASLLPKLLLTNKVQSTINSMRDNGFSVDVILKNKKKKEINLAMAHLSFIAHAYIWGGDKPQKILPEVIAKPWVKLSQFLGRPPILSYASYCLDNWFKIDNDKPIVDNFLRTNLVATNKLASYFLLLYSCINSSLRRSNDSSDTSIPIFI